MTAYKILGIDPGVAAAGWCLLAVRDTEIVYEASGVWKTPDKDREGQKLSVWQRAALLVSQMCETFAEHGIAGRDVVAAVESPSYGSKYCSHNVSFCAGLLSSVFNQFGVRNVSDVAAAGWKRKLCGKTDASKKETKLAAAEKLGDDRLASVSADESDAIGIALWRAQRTS